MDIRSSLSKVTFSHDTALPGSEDRLPPGEYEVVTEEEHLQGVTLEAHRRTATYFVLKNIPRSPGRTEMHPITLADLQTMIDRDRTFSDDALDNKAASMPRKETK